jgi:hypothetical protein
MKAMDRGVKTMGNCGIIGLFGRGTLHSRGLQIALLMLVIGASLPEIAWAQFQPPTDEELKLVAEPKAPGAAAIYLYREETVDDNLHYHGFTARIKVLTEKGKELATVQVPYLKGEGKITDIKARTIHADGTVIPLNVKPSDLVEQKGAGYQVNKVVFTMPSVEVGSILEYKWELRYSDDTLSSPYWDIQQPYYVRKAHYSFVALKDLNNVRDNNGNIANRLLYSTLLPQDVKVNYEAASQRYTVDIADVPAIPDEEFMPPIGAWIEKVRFYYSPYDSPEEFWKKEGARWSKEMDRFADQSKGLKEAVSKIVAPDDKEDAKARKLYDAVMALENTDYTRKKSQAELKNLHEKQAKDAEDVWKQKSGDSEELALLYLAMVRSAGLKAYALRVCNRDQEIFNQHLLSVGQLDDVLVDVVLDGKDTVVDPGERFAGFGELAWNHTQAGGIRQSEKGVVFAGTPVNVYKSAVTMQTADLTIEKDGSVKGTARITMTGPAALRWRHVAIENDEDEVKKQFNEEIKGMVPDGVTAEFDHFLGLEDYHSQLMAVLKVSGSMGTVTGKRMIVPGVFFRTRSKHPFVAEAQRIAPVDMQYAETLQDQVSYHLPETLVVDTPPAATSIPWGGHAVMDLKSTTDKDGITITRNLVRGFAMLPPKDYPELRDFYQKVATADQQQMVLTAAPVGKSGSE